MNLDAELVPSSTRATARMPKLSGSCGSCLRWAASSSNIRLGWMSRLCWYLLAYSSISPRDLVVEDLADRHAGIDSHRLHGEHLERPVAAEADVAEAGRHVHEQSQPADRRAAFDLRHQVVRHRPLDRAAQVELVRTEHQPLRRNLDPPHAVGLGHVEHHLFVDHQLVVQREVVAVGIELRLIERIDDDVGAQSFTNRLAGENHGKVQVPGSEASRSPAALSVHATHATPIFGQNRFIEHSSHFGFRAAQICRPWWIMRCAKSTHSLCGTSCIRSCSIFVGVGVLGEAQPAADPRDVRVDDDAGRHAVAPCRARRSPSCARRPAARPFAPCRAAPRRRTCRPARGCTP